MSVFWIEKYSNYCGGGGGGAARFAGIGGAAPDPGGVGCAGGRGGGIVGWPATAAAGVLGVDAGGVGGSCEGDGVRLTGGGTTGARRGTCGVTPSFEGLCGTDGGAAIGARRVGRRGGKRAG